MMNKIALVTGGNRGIGLATVKRLLTYNIETILACRNEYEGNKIKEELNHPLLHCMQLDVADPASIDQCYYKVMKEHSKLDILINNAGTNYDLHQNVLEADLDEFAPTFEVNLLGPWRLCKHFVPKMIEQGYGRVVNVSSGSGSMEKSSNGAPIYSISKAAINMLTVKIAEATSGTDVLINAVCPGWVKTEMGGQEAPRTAEEAAHGILWAATLEKGGPNGDFFRDGKTIPW